MKFKEKMKPYLIRFKTALLPCALPTFILLFFGPLDLAHINRKDICFDASGILFYFLLLFLVGWLFLTTIVALFKNKWLDNVINLIIGCSLAAYIQANFLNIDFGNLNGSAINWSDYTLHGIINAVIWVAIISIPFLVYFFLKKYWKTSILFVCILLIGMQATSLVTSIISEQTEPDVERPAFSIKDMYHLSKNENIIVLGLDAFSNGTLDDVLAEYPDAIDELNDFTYYNNLSPEFYDTTFPSLVTMYTTKQYDITKPYNDFFKQAWNDEFTTNFYDTLKEKNFTTNFFMIGSALANSFTEISGKIDNAVTSYGYDIRILYIKFFKLSAYRYAPHFLKKTFWLYSSEFDDIHRINKNKFEKDEMFTDNDPEFYENLCKKGLTAQNEKNVFVAYHLNGVHPPFIMTDDGLASEKEVTKTQQARGVLKIVEEYILQLKKLGIYDNATILITADHGDTRNGKIVGRIHNAGPILFFKKPNETNEKMKVSNAPIMQTEILPSLYEAAFNEKLLQAKTFSDFEGIQRQRIVRRVVKSQKDSFKFDLCETYDVIGEYKDFDITKEEKETTELVDAYYR